MSSEIPRVSFSDFALPALDVPGDQTNPNLQLVLPALDTPGDHPNAQTLATVGQPIKEEAEVGGEVIGQANDGAYANDIGDAELGEGGAESSVLTRTSVSNVLCSHIFLSIHFVVPSEARSQRRRPRRGDFHKEKRLQVSIYSFVFSHLPEGRGDFFGVSTSSLAAYSSSPSVHSSAAP